jgi:hypothetical protein
VLVPSGFLARWPVAVVGWADRRAMG